MFLKKNKIVLCLPNKRLCESVLFNTLNSGIKILIIFILPLFLSACAPTYPKEKVLESIVKVCRETYDVKAKAKQVNRTISVLIPESNFLIKEAFGSFNFNPKKEKELNKIIFSITQVLLNSKIDKDTDFYLIKLTEQKGEIECSIIGNINDLKQSWIGSFPPGELFQRRLLIPKINSAKDEVPQKEFEEIKWPDFLIKQIRKRVINKFPDKIDLIGNYTKDKRFIFVFASIQKKPKINSFTLQTIARVLDAYKFEDFKEVSFTDIKTGQVTVIAKEKLKKYR